MITILRKIRKRLIKNGNISSYLLYAIGEILLVIIGILIALQINNWNEGRKLQKEEHNYLVALKAEVNNNIENLKKDISQNRRETKSAKQIASLMASKDPFIEEDSLARLVQRAFMGFTRFEPKDAIINELISTGNLKIISNDKIKAFISGWKTMIVKLKIQEDGNSHYYGRCSDLMIEQLSFSKLMEATSLLKILDVPSKKSKVEIDNRVLLSSTVFENNLLLFIATGTFLEEKQYLPLLKELEQMEEIIETEIATKT